MKSVPIATKVVNSNPAYDKVFSIQIYVIMFVIDLRHDDDFSPDTPVSSNNKTDHHDIVDQFESIKGVIINIAESGVKHHTL